MLLLLKVDCRTVPSEIVRIFQLDLLTSSGCQASDASEQVKCVLTLLQWSAE